MKKFLLFLTLFLSAVGIATAEVKATIDLTAQKWANQTSVIDKTLTIGTCQAVFATNGGSTAPKYYTNSAGNAVRMYTSNTLTISAPDNYYITEIIVTGVNNSSKNCSFDNFALNSETEKGSLTIATDKKSGTWVCGSDKPTSVVFKSQTESKQVWVQTISITIKPLASDPTDCGLKFAAETANVTYGNTYTLPALTNPNGVNVNWSSSDETVATFDAENNIKILKAGTTTIKAELADKGTAYTTNTSASYTLTVAKGTPTFAYASDTYDYVMQAEGAGFSAPALNNPGGLAVTYASDNTKVATVVESTGVITPVTRGKAVITATGAGNDCWNGATATLTVNITKKIPGLTFDNTEVTKYIDELSAYKGETPTTDPEDLVITYSVSPASVASINESTGELTFTGATGVATITAVSTETTTHESKSATYTVSVSKRNPALAFDETAVELSTSDTYAGQAVKYTLLEGLAKGFTINYETSNSSVANVDALTGAVTLTGAEGTATITAYGSGNTYYTNGSATYTIKVAKQYIWSDTKAVLVTKASDLKAGDVIIIANNAAKVAMATTYNTDNRKQTSITITNNEITSISGKVLLLELEKDGDYWLFKTLNYEGTNGYFTTAESTTSKNNYLKITQSIDNDYPLSKIAIASNGVATIKLNKGSDPSTTTNDQNRNLIQYNTSGLFSCYGGATQQSVYIYRLEWSTTITGETAECTPSVENGNTTLTASSKFKTNSTASEFVVKMNGVAINATVKKVGNSVSVDMVGLPYVPGAVFTISPVVDGKELHPVTLGITIPTLPVVDLGAVTLKLYFDKDAYGSTSTSTCALDAWAYLPVVLKDAARDEVLAADDARRNLALTFKEFANSVADSEIWGWYDENKDQVQWCKYNYLTVPVEDGTAKIGETELATLSESPVKLTFTPVYSFNVANKYASLIPSATPGSLSAPARAPEGFTVQNVELTALPVLQAWGNTPDVSGVESVVVEGVDGAVEYYNMQGVRVEGELAPGMYIRRQGRSVSKVQIR